MPEFKWDPPGLKRVLLNKPCCLRERWHLRGSFQRYKGTLEPIRSNVSFAGGLFCREGWDTDEEALAQTDRYAQWLNDVHTKQGAGFGAATHDYIGMKTGVSQFGRLVEGRRFEGGGGLGERGGGRCS